jgi:hypothetical protein
VIQFSSFMLSSCADLLLHIMLSTCKVMFADELSWEIMRGWAILIFAKCSNPVSWRKGMSCLD